LRIGRETLLAILREIWNRYKGKVLHVAEFFGHGRLEREWNVKDMRPSWAEFVRAWTCTNKLPRIDLMSAVLEGAYSRSGELEARIVVGNSGEVGADIEIVLVREGVGAYTRRRRVFVDSQASVEIRESVGRKPDHVVLDPELRTLQGTIEPQILHFR
jgi:hypothetical protein